jgi:hypothetical protein
MVPPETLENPQLFRCTDLKVISVPGEVLSFLGSEVCHRGVKCIPVKGMW